VTAQPASLKASVLRAVLDLPALAVNAPSTTALLVLSGQAAAPPTTALLLTVLETVALLLLAHHTSQLARTTTCALSLAHPPDALETTALRPTAPLALSGHLARSAPTALCLTALATVARLAIAHHHQLVRTLVPVPHPATPKPRVTEAPSPTALLAVLTQDARRPTLASEPPATVKLATAHHHQTVRTPVLALRPAETALALAVSASNPTALPAPATHLAKRPPNAPSATAPETAAVPSLAQSQSQTTALIASNHAPVSLAMAHNALRPPARPNAPTRLVRPRTAL